MNPNRSVFRRGRSIKRKGLFVLHMVIRAVHTRVRSDHAIHLYHGAQGGARRIALHGVRVIAARIGCWLVGPGVGRSIWPRPRTTALR